MSGQRGQGKTGHDKGQTRQDGKRQSKNMQDMRMQYQAREEKMKDNTSTAPDKTRHKKSKRSAD